MQPFIKWAGGKRQLLPEIMDRLPKEFNNYYEPFIGGGALLLELQPKNAVIGDVNKTLITTYKIIEETPNDLMKVLSEYETKHNNSDDKKVFYYEMRDSFNEKLENNIYDIYTSALFIYLNKTCFNGLYRVNSKGLFNVPFNNKKEVKIYDTDNIRDISKYMKHVDAAVRDFEETCRTACKGDFVFFDSPYVPLNDDSFQSYTKEGFSLEEHVRLSNLYKELSDKGIYCMLTNHNTKLINDLYKDFNIDVVNVKRLINRDANKRTGEEVIITNY